MIHDSHGTDADGQRCRDKGIGELVVSLAAGFALEPFAQVFDAGFQVYGLADERAKGKRDDEHGSAGGRQCFTVNDEHLLHGAAQSDKQNAQPRRLHERVLDAGRDKTSAYKAQQSARNQKRDVDDRSPNPA